MQKKLMFAALGILLVGGGAAAAMWMRAHAAPAHPPAPKVNMHGEGIDREMTALRAMYDAPTGATPCESAFNAFKAAQDSATKLGKTQLILKLAPHDDFIRMCQALPAAAQPCLAPLYSNSHRDECFKVKPDAALLDPMFKIKPIDGAQAGEQDADRQFMSTSKPPPPRPMPPPGHP